jgi:hypothetical protein
MADKPTPKANTATDERRARLAQTLRANLKRRKQQSRQRSQDQPSPGLGNPATPTSEPSSDA